MDENIIKDSSYHGKMVPNVTKFGDLKSFSFYIIIVSQYIIFISLNHIFNKLLSFS